MATGLYAVVVRMVVVSSSFPTIDEYHLFYRYLVSRIKHNIIAPLLYNLMYIVVKFWLATFWLIVVYTFN